MESDPKKAKVRDDRAPEKAPSDLSHTDGRAEWKASLTCLELYDVLQQSPDKVSGFCQGLHVHHVILALLCGVIGSHGV